MYLKEKLVFKSIVNDSVLIRDEIMSVTKNVSTNMTSKISTNVKSTVSLNFDNKK